MNYVQLIRLGFNLLAEVPLIVFIILLRSANKPTTTAFYDMFQEPVGKFVFSSVQQLYYSFVSILVMSEQKAFCFSRI